MEEIWCLVLQRFSEALPAITHAIIETKRDPGATTL